MEMSVSFTGENDHPDPQLYIQDSSSLGKVFIPREGVLISAPIGIRYEKHPWIEQFELDGIKAAPDRRTGYGTKGAKGFVKSLSTIYARAYDDYREFGGDERLDAAAYFAHAAEHFINIAGDEKAAKLYKNFCGFAENMWREGDRHMHDIVMYTVLPMIRQNNTAWIIFENNITEEFKGYIKGER